MRRPEPRQPLSAPWLFGLTLLVALASALPLPAIADPISQVKTLGKASLLLKEQGRDIIAYQADVRRVCPPRP